jgi:hypothetical protein
VFDFRNLCILSSAFSFGTFAVLMIYPPAIYLLFGIDSSLSTDVMSRRASILFLSVGVILWGQRNIVDTDARSALALGMFVFMSSFVVLGLAEFMRGSVGAGILLAVLIELLMALLFLKVLKGENA